MGGPHKLVEYLRQHLNYPQAAKEANVTGRVFVSFIVERDGQINDVILLKGLGYGCDEEAIRIIETMPRWNPGTQSQWPIRVRYNLPISFGVPYPKVKK